MLSVENLHVGFGKAEVLRGMTLTCRPGVITALIGPNGAGKSTLVKTVAGLNQAQEGKISLDGREMPFGDPAAMSTSGVRLVPQGRALFTSLSVRDNLRMGAYLNSDKKAWRRRIDELAPLFPEIMDRLDAPVGTFSGGQQQLVAVMRGLMIPARILMLDEPSLGVAPILVQRLGEILRALSTNGEMGILLVEQNLNLAIQAADEVAILARGTTQAVVPPERVRGDAGERFLRGVFFGTDAPDAGHEAPTTA